MHITISTWNINSVRLRIDLVSKFIKAERPDVLCLQETKCPDDKFPLKRFARLGYTHVALNGQKGYHGVAVVSRLPFDSTSLRNFCSKTDCRHISVTLGEKAGLRDPTTLHNFYVPAGGDEPDPEINVKFAHKLAFLDEMRRTEALGAAYLNVHPGSHMHEDKKMRDDGKVRQATLERIASPVPISTLTTSAPCKVRSDGP